MTTIEPTPTPKPKRTPRAMWRIERDYDHERCKKEYGAQYDLTRSEVGTKSSNYDEAFSDKLTKRFRMKDDDGDIIYGGACTPDTEFEPLDDFGEGNFGCTSIEFKNDATGEWEVL